jgi:AbrB family looped-hinge helix DNA binding protein
MEVGNMEDMELAKPVELRIRTRMSAKGRFVIPAAVRQAMGIAEGGVLDLHLVDNELRISTMRTRLRSAQEELRRYIPEGVLLSEELSAERREAAKHE